MIAVNDAKDSNGFSTVLMILGGVVAFVLFGVVLLQMGLISTGGVEHTAVVTQNLITQNMAFDQSEIRVQAGEAVSLQLRNADMYGHSFDIDDLNVHVLMDSRDVAMATFEAPEPGVYTFYCAVPGHTEAGMSGTLIVE